MEERHGTMNAELDPTQYIFILRVSSSSLQKSKGTLHTESVVLMTFNSEYHALFIVFVV